jgi:hypothetical protein
VNEAKTLDQLHYECNQIKAIAATIAEDKLMSWAINSGYQ